MEILIKNLKKKYEEDEVLKGINLHHKGNGLICIVGPSGSGKSTLLNLLGCLDSAKSGEIFIDGIDITKLNQNELTNFRNQFIGFVFQDFNLLKQLTVSENIRLSSYVQGNDDVKTAQELIEKIGLSGQENKHINLLSGGEKQRVAIARALISNPKLILADEPTGNLDLENGHMTFKMLKEISKEHLVIVITHNIALAEEYSDKIYTISDGMLVKGDNVDFQPEIKQFNFIKFSFYLKGLLKLSVRNLLSKKWRVLTTMLSLLVTLFCISILFSLRFGINDAIQSIYKRQFDVDILYVGKNSPRDKMLEIRDGYIYEDDLELINELDNISMVLPDYNVLYISSDSTNSDGTIRIIENNQYFKEGMKPYLIGEFPENDDEIIVSMETAQKFYPDNYENILNQEFIIDIYSVNQKVKIVGINTIHTNTHYYVLKSLVDELKSKADLNYKNNVKINFISTDNYDIGSDTSTDNVIKNISDVSSLNLLYGETIEDDNEILISSQSFYDGLVNFTNDAFSLADINNKLIDQNLMNQYLSKDQYIYPNSFSFCGKDMVKVVGIYRGSENEIITSNHLYNKMTKINPAEVDIYIKDLTKYKTTKDILEKFGYRVYSNYEAQLEDVNTSIHDFTVIFIILTSVTISIAFILLYILIANQVQHRISEFGILKALGTKKRDIVLLLISEGIIIGMITSIMIVVLSFIITPKLNLLMNRFVYNINYENIQFLNNNFFSIVSVLITGILFTILVSIIPGLKAAKLNPVDAINRG